MVFVSCGLDRRAYRGIKVDVGIEARQWYSSDGQTQLECALISDPYTVDLEPTFKAAASNCSSTKSRRTT